MQGENLKSLSTRGSSGALPCPYIPALSIRAVSEIGLGREDWRRCQKIVTKVLLVPGCADSTESISVGNL
jgi:hypothetical protein